jgi:hypothetical protein
LAAGRIARSVLPARQSLSTVTRFSAGRSPASVLSAPWQSKHRRGGLRIRSHLAPSGYISGKTPATRRLGAGTMASKSQSKAMRAHRRRAAARGLVRVEVQAPRQDASLIRAVAETLRGGAETAEALRSTLAKALRHPEVTTAFDIFGSELSDEAFAGVFDRPRQRNWREVDF